MYFYSPINKSLSEATYQKQLFVNYCRLLSVVVHCDGFLFVDVVCGCLVLFIVLVVVGLQGVELVL